MSSKAKLSLKDLKERLRPFMNTDNEVRLSNEANVTDVGKMLNTHIQMLEANPGNRAYMPYYDRLVAMLNILEGGLV